ncbi:MAG: RHS repeat-associated core domain-containing protein, partial [Deltaproteobacteria bacterium]|nr:RHS repeat-associated core domain-containing protein [Deltaproteobacteria bacterium]
MTDESADVEWTTEYDPFGNALCDWGRYYQDVTGRHECVPNDWVSGERVEEMNLRLPGQYYDEESGLHYNWHRYYDPKIGRYLTPDHLIGSIMPYEYANSNPLGFIDGNGLDETPLPAGGNLGAGLVGAGMDDVCDALLDGYDPDSLAGMPSGGCQNFKDLGLGEKADAMIEQGIKDITFQAIAVCGLKGFGNKKAPKLGSPKNPGGYNFPSWFRPDAKRTPPMLGEKMEKWVERLLPDNSPNHPARWGLRGGEAKEILKGIKRLGYDLFGG